MEVQGLWSNDVPSQLENEAQIYDKIEELLDMIDTSNNYNTIYFKDSFLYEQEINNTMFVEWLFDPSVCELRDLKKELIKKLEKALDIDKTEYEIKKTNIKTPCSGKNIFLISLNKENPLNVWTISGYFEAKRLFLLRVENKYKFVIDINECFLNIYFDTTVKSSINSLNNQFNDIKKEIVNHLRKLDEYYDLFLKHRESGDDNRKICNDFKAFSGIDCSPQAGRGKVSGLKRTFYSCIAEKDVVLCCELHTKFINYNRNKEKQDRIYFHPGEAGVNKGKIIVIHIGDHK